MIKSVWLNHIFLMFLMVAYAVPLLAQNTQSDHQDSLDAPHFKSKSTDDFYQNLKEKASKYWFTKELHDLFIASPSGNKTIWVERSEDPYLAFEGRYIRHIRLKTLAVFGTTVADTSQKVNVLLERLGNDLHVNSRDQTISNYLLMKRGDRVDPYQLADNERILREAPFIQDARIRLIPVPDCPDSVDVVVITKDRYAFGATGYAGGNKKLTGEIFNRNLFGTGHRLTLAMQVDRDEPSNIGYRSSYRVENTGGTFISTELSYTDDHNKDITQLSFSRRFYTPQVKYAGGLDVGHIVDYDVQPDTTTSINANRINYQDLWIGRSLLPPNQIESRTQLVLSGRIYRSEYIERVVKVEVDSNRSYQDRRMILGSLAVSKRNYYKNQLIYGFGRTEDTPVGHLIELVGGWERRELNGHRLYTGIKLSKGLFFRSWGYLEGKIGIGGFINQKRYEQETFKLNVQHFSNLFTAEDYKFRYFINFNYLLGLRRYDEDILRLDDRIIRGLEENELGGKQRLSMNVEFVAFTPLYYYGFQLACFTFFDLAILGTNRNHIFSERYYSGLGAGIRIHNERLLFDTIQIRFAFYPAPPAGVSQSRISFLGEKILTLGGFEVKAPQIVLYE